MPGRRGRTGRRILKNRTPLRVVLGTFLAAAFALWGATAWDARAMKRELEPIAAQKLDEYAHNQATPLPAGGGGVGGLLTAIRESPRPEAGEAETTPGVPEDRSEPSQDAGNPEARRPPPGYEVVATTEAYREYGFFGPATGKIRLFFMVETRQGEAKFSNVDFSMRREDGKWALTESEYSGHALVESQARKAFLEQGFVIP